MLDLFLCLATVIGAPPAPAASDTLRVTVEGVPAAKGNLLVAFYDAAEGFNDPERAARVLAVPAAEGRMDLSAPDLPAGRYAVAVLHDADADGAMTTSVLGLPKEAYGFSNGARGTFGPPSFGESVVECGAGGDPVRVAVK